MAPMTTYLWLSTICSRNAFLSTRNSSFQPRVFPPFSASTASSLPAGIPGSAITCPLPSVILRYSWHSFRYRSRISSCEALGARKSIFWLVTVNICLAMDSRLFF